MKTLLEIDNDYIRADQIAAITVAPGDGEGDAEVNVYLIGNNDPITWWHATWDEAEAAQVKLVKKWVEAL